MKEETAISRLKDRIRAIPDYPKTGITFRDITPLLKDKAAFRLCIDELAKKLSGTEIDYIVGVEARGFILGSALAYALGAGFIPVRKKGKLPYEKISKDYSLEYGNETLEMHKDSIEDGEKIVIVDDLLATGGTAGAVGHMVKELGGNILGYLFLVELSDLKGRERLAGTNIISLIKY